MLFQHILTDHGTATDNQAVYTYRCCSVMLCHQLNGMECRIHKNVEDEPHTLEWRYARGTTLYLCQTPIFKNLSKVLCCMENWFLLKTSMECYVWPLFGKPPHATPKWAYLQVCIYILAAPIVKVLVMRYVPRQSSILQPKLSPWARKEVQTILPWQSCKS